MTKKDYLTKLRHCPSIDILEIVISYMRKTTPEHDRTFLEGAYDHRKAELIMNKLYSNIPSEIWRLVS